MFNDSVIGHRPDGEFPYALRGLDDCIVNIFDQEPLMPMNTLKYKEYTVHYAMGIGSRYGVRH